MILMLIVLHSDMTNKRIYIFISLLTCKEAINL